MANQAPRAVPVLRLRVRTGKPERTQGVRLPAATRARRGRLPKVRAVPIQRATDRVPVFGTGFSIRPSPQRPTATFQSTAAGTASRAFAAPRRTALNSCDESRKNWRKRAPPRRKGIIKRRLSLRVRSAPRFAKGIISASASTEKASRPINSKVCSKKRFNWPKRTAAI